MTMQAINPLEEFQWQPQPAAEQFVRGLVNQFLANCPAAAELAQRLHDQPGTRFFDWIDSITIPEATCSADQLLALGFKLDGDRTGQFAHVYAHPGGMFPRIVLSNSATTAISLKTESVADFLTAAQSPQYIPIEGEPLALLRRAKIAQQNNMELWIVERHGTRGFVLPGPDPAGGILALRHWESFRTRLRNFATDAAGFEHAHKLIDAAIADVGIDRACDLFFAAEREFWQRRNHAAQVQKSRQDRLGLGWANHDHHTYRSSRQNFSQLIAIFEKLGFTCRERYYAGKDAGWGAQIVEQPYAGIVIFADVDLSPDELYNDFSHEPLEPRNTLGTVGLWCGLHGDSFLQSGMHHLECQFDFDALQHQLQRDAHIKTMKPFTDYPYLRQAFTEGEQWPIDPTRIDKLLSAKLITPDQAHQFRTHGAIGSHLENLERNEGFKGFNQKGVSEIIAQTDPRKNMDRS